MAGVIITAAIMVLLFPLRWATGAARRAASLQQPQADEEAAADHGVAASQRHGSRAALLNSRQSSFFAAFASGEALMVCPERMR